mmetsp:Transcript_67038/g.158182  ORF Transcript_67038/g.158182 Transcript_67038/m.158182 type:complete len:273 (+) Transcript_67038:586-1404(+)
MPWRLGRTCCRCALSIGTPRSGCSSFRSPSSTTRLTASTATPSRLRLGWVPSLLFQATQAPSWPSVRSASRAPMIPSGTSPDSASPLSSCSRTCCASTPLWTRRPSACRTPTAPATSSSASATARPASSEATSPARASSTSLTTPTSSRTTLPTTGTRASRTWCTGAWTGWTRGTTRPCRASSPPTTATSPPTASSRTSSPSHRPETCSSPCTTSKSTPCTCPTRSTSRRCPTLTMTAPRWPSTAPTWPSTWPRSSTQRSMTPNKQRRRVRG